MQWLCASLKGKHSMDLSLLFRRSLGGVRCMVLGYTPVPLAQPGGRVVCRSSMLHSYSSQPLGTAIDGCLICSHVCLCLSDGARLCVMWCRVLSTAHNCPCIPRILETCVLSLPRPAHVAVCTVALLVGVVALWFCGQSRARWLQGWLVRMGIIRSRVVCRASGGIWCHTG
jgi:hypothetical protein